MTFSFSFQIASHKNFNRISYHLIPSLSESMEIDNRVRIVKFNIFYHYTMHIVIPLQLLVNYLKTL